MIAIVGMPRSGTTFLQNVMTFYGHRLNPPVFTDCIQDGLNLCDEPEVISSKLTVGISGGELVSHFERIAKLLADAPGQREAVIKQPQLVFCKSELLYFSKIILTYRSLDSWLVSAEKHRVIDWIYTKPVWLKPYLSEICRSKNQLLALGDIWHREVNKTWEYLNGEGRSVILFEFSDSGVDRFLMEFGFPEECHNVIKSDLWLNSSTSARVGA